METVDLFIDNASELVTCASSGVPKRGNEMADVGLIQNGSIAIDQGHIVALGPSAEMREEYRGRETINASGRAVMPGFIDCHTHTVFGGDRAHEFEMRIQGATYMEIMAAGGGIVSTMQNTRDADEVSLFISARRRIREMMAFGSTTIEIKTGYGLDTATELKMLRVIEQLARSVSCRIVPTFLGAHTLPPEYKNDPEGYVALVINEMIPTVQAWYAGSYFAKRGTPLFIDVFCEDHAFDVEQSRRILEAGKEAGMLAKIHVDQFNAFGGTEMALELEATSLDHLEVTDGNAITKLAESESIGVLLPAVNFNLGLKEFAEGRGMIDANAAVALATDLNPGSSPCYSMPLVMAIACRYLKLLPSEAVCASTINAAYAVGLDEQIGSLEVGKQADLIILKEADYRHVSYFMGGNPVDQVIIKGKMVHG